MIGFLFAALRLPLTPPYELKLQSRAEHRAYLASLGEPLPPYLAPELDLPGRPHCPHRPVDII